MTTPTPEQLRQAAAHLAKAVATAGYTRGALITDAALCLPEGAAARTAILNSNGVDWMWEALRWRLLLEALWQEQEARRVPATRHCLGCGATEGQHHRYSCLHRPGNLNDHIPLLRLLDDLLAGTSPAPAAGE